MTEIDTSQVRVREHPLVRDVVADTATPPRLALIYGYAGESSRRGYVRLYLDEELRRWAEVPEAAVRRCIELSADAAPPFGATALWVGYSDPDDLVRHPVLLRGDPEEEADITNVRDLRALRPRAAVLTSRENGKPGGGGPAPVNVPKGTG